eukprot:m.476594 g.476594  ORF g.476594 m.476594 type:complete len:138 (+) comp20582_c0_seq1:351-764(+)
MATSSSPSPSSRLPFREKHSLEDRKAEVQKVIQNPAYQNCIPVIAEKNPTCKNLQAMSKRKFLLPNDMTLAHFMQVIRKRIGLQPSSALFMQVETWRDGKTTHDSPPTSETMARLYQDYKADDGFLYVVYSEDDVYG